MPSRVTKSSRPVDWPSFTTQDNDSKDTYQEDLKKEIVSEYGEEALKQAWVKICKALESVTPPIAEQGLSALPIFQFNDVIGPQNQEILDQMKSKGSFIVRSVIPEVETAEHFKDLQNFLAENREIQGWPAKSSAIFSIFDSPVQLKLRIHPNQLKFQRLIQSLIGDSSCSLEEQKAQCEPILYPDALRVRRPGQEFLGLGPHIDAGSLSRRADPIYHKTDDKIFSGHPENYDSYHITHRHDAKLALFPSGVHSGALRTMQGWTALTPCGPGEGGLMLLPDIKTATAYMILRSFFRPPEDGAWEEAEKWTLDDSAWFPGTKRWNSQLLSPASHTHLRLEETLFSTSAVGPGNTIWWHADMCHDVETQHNGAGPASIVYIPAASSTPANIEYICRYWKDLLAGVSPDDYGRVTDRVNQCRG